MKITYQEESKERLDKYLLEHLAISRSQIKKVILSGQVTVNGEIPSVHHWLRKNDQIIYSKEATKKADTKLVNEPEIIEQNENYLVLNKPHNLLAHPTDKGEKNTLVDWLLKKYPKIKKVGDDPLRPGIVHRLDREVSGLMVIPLTQKYFDLLKEQFQKRTIKKEYTALVHGKILNDKGEINTSLERDKKTGLMKIQNIDDSGKIALTIYEVIKRYKNYTLLKVQIKTGRMHQIRAHFFSIGHSIVGDKLYKTKDLRKKKKTVDLRIFLHAHFLSFKDEEGKWQKYSLDLPKELTAFLNTAK